MTKINLIDIFKPDRWKSVFIFILRWLLKKLDKGTQLEEVHIIEQYMFRFIKCSSCLAQGSCENCGCAIPARMWVRSDQCSARKWGEFMEEEQWNEFKKAFKIEFKLEIDGKLYSENS